MEYERIRACVGNNLIQLLSGRLDLEIPEADQLAHDLLMTLKRQGLELIHEDSVDETPRIPE